MAQRVAYFDCFSGASGDMILGALVDAGASPQALSAALASLPCGPISLRFQRVIRGGIRATQVHVETPHDHTHRGLSQISDIISKSPLPATVRDNALHVFTRLAEAEAAVHGCPVAKVHFHEVGALDAIADIVGACAALNQLGIETVQFSVLPLGGGTVQSAHGVLPVPAPATALLVKGLECRMGPVESELLTPTGAAILTSLGAQAPQALLRVESLGYGAGTREFPGHPNLLRVLLGEAADTGSEDAVWVLEANLDDMTPQLCGYAIERLLAAGALDAWAAPIQMKKSRPALMLCAIVEEESLAKVEEIFFAETTTFGVRRHRALRRKLLRDLVTVHTPQGVAKVKVGKVGDKVVTVSPEYEDCRRIAQETGTPLRDVMAAVMQAYAAQVGTPPRA